MTTLASICAVACGRNSRGAGAPPDNIMTGSGWVTLTTSAGLSFSAASRDSVGPGKGVAIYIHGKEIEDLGYEAAADGGYDVVAFVDALADAGYAALGPLRPGGRSIPEYDAIHERSIRHMTTDRNASVSRLFVIGFSKGGLLNLRIAVDAGLSPAAFIFMSPAPFTGADSWSNTATDPNLQRIIAPVHVTLGANEPNAEIVTNVNKFISDLQRLGKTVTSKTDYPGDHQWFHKVRSEYWPDIVNFMASH
ncbi:MAG: hypothetical protein HYY84_09860 [Deltaproteobacteria bacterium]|nr:hypothetical protein [Deltaproteobacteria bacterium]